VLKPPARGERIVMLWSLDCVYCEPNMQALAKLQRAHPLQIQLLTIATDSVSQRAHIAGRLEAAGMQGYPARAYTESSPGRINFLIDPTWGGELPRTIVIRADGSHTAISGELTEKQLAQIAP
jgi:iron complex outermembrane receptor protein